MENKNLSYVIVIIMIIQAYFSYVNYKKNLKDLNR